MLCNFSIAKPHVIGLSLSHVHTIFRNCVVSDWNGWGVNFPIMIVSHIIHAMTIIVIEMKPIVATYTLLC